MTHLLNRSEAPELTKLLNFDVLEPEYNIMSNGIPLYTIQSGSDELIKLEFIFKAGAIYQRKPLCAAMTCQMLREGTSGKSSKEISQSLEHYGAFISTTSDQDHSSIILFCLSKFLDEILPLVFEIITDPIFPEHELNLVKTNSKQRLSIENKKVGFVSRHAFLNSLYGSVHPYGLYPDQQDYDNLNQSDLVDFYRNTYTSGRCTIMISGGADLQCKNKIENIFGKNYWGDSINSNTDLDYKLPEYKAISQFVNVDEAIQCGIRTGKNLFNKTHPDFAKLAILTTVLGGYFGSRLMTNLRENKGYTYGVSANLVSMKDTGYLIIGTEVGAEVSEKASAEIMNEIVALSCQLIPINELNMVRSYLEGSFLRSLDGPFALSEKWKSILMYDLDISYFENYLKALREIKPDELFELAAKYFKSESFSVIIAGKKY